MTVLWVGQAEQYKRLSDAVKAAAAGDTINVRAGTYYDDDVRVDKPLTIVGVGGMAHLQGTGKLANDKALMIVNTTGLVTIENFEFSGASVWDNNGAGIRWSNGDLTIKNSYFHDNQDGILSLDIPNGHLKVVNSEFAHNGYGDGYTHAIYVNKVASVEVTGSYFHDTLVGHHIKSRAAVTTVTNSVLIDGTGQSSFAVDAPNGGVVTITGNKVVQSVDSDNPAIFHYGGETSKGTYATNTLTIDNNVIVNDKPNGYVLGQELTPSKFEMTGNQFYGVNKIANVSVNAHDNVTLSSRPSITGGIPQGNGGSDGPTDLSASITRLYHVALDRAPEAGGLAFWIAQEKAGMSHMTVAQNFLDSHEFQGKFGGLGNTDFLGQLYNSAFHRQPDAGGEHFWLQYLGAGHSRAEVLLGFADSAEMKAISATWSNIS
jgi:Domain of unknown function (DUF4214)